MARVQWGQRVAQAHNKAVESAPELSATAKGWWPERASSDGKSASVGFGVAEAAIALQSLITFVEQLFDL